MIEEKEQQGDLLKELREENARLNTVSVNLLKSRDAAVKEADGLRCTLLEDYDYMMEQGHAAYPEVFFNDQIDPYEMAKALREVGKDPFISMPASVRYLVCTAGFILAKQCGWKMPEQPKLNMEPEI